MRICTRSVVAGDFIRRRGQRKDAPFRSAANAFTLFGNKHSASLFYIAFHNICTTPLQI
jgi:hypothetical protein